MAKVNDMQSENNKQPNKLELPTWLARLVAVSSVIGAVAKAIYWMIRLFYWIWRLFKD